MPLLDDTVETDSLPELFAFDDSSCSSSDSEDSDEGFDDIDTCLDAAREQHKELFFVKNLVKGHNKNNHDTKRQKTVDNKPIVFVRFNTRMGGRPQPVTVKALLDSVGTASLVTEKYAEKLRVKKYTTSTTVWSTPGGELKTNKKVKSQFMIPELHDNRLIEHDFHVTKSLGNYDMIIGRDVMEELGIGMLTDRRFADMSTGEQRRCLLGRALVHDPVALVLDEPTSGLDLTGTFHYLDMVRVHMKKGKTVLLVTHHIHEIPPEIERVILLKGGCVLEDGEKSLVLTEANLSRLFDRPIALAQANGWYQALPG